MSFKKRLISGEFVVLSEMNTPKGVDISEFITNARKVKGRVDAVIIPDMDSGVMKMSALAGGVLMQQQGIEAVIHTYCRDKNRLAIQGDLLAAHVLGVQNVLVVQGEPIENTDHRDAKPVYDLDETALFRVIQSLQEGADMGGFELKGAPTFFVGCSLGKYSDDASLDKEIEKAQEKIKAGARFVVTPYIFDVNHFAKDLEKIKTLGVPVIASVFLIKSVGIARYMAINEPGSRISEDLIKRIRKAPDRDTECLKIAGETVASLKKLVQGVVIVTLGWENRLPSILDYANI
ncbi:MAG: methylenetetrahydrofolate reductase [Desulfobacterales bacterium]|nr:methylenetetrahydrofolate reductase [Desulfobacterales bacterium]